MDSRKRIIQMEAEKYTTLVTNFIIELETTRLQKLARLNTGDAVRENIAKHMQEQVVSTFTIKTFTELQPALNWLKSV